MEGPGEEKGRESAAKSFSRSGGRASEGLPTYACHMHAPEPEFGRSLAGHEIGTLGSIGTATPSVCLSERTE